MCNMVPHAGFALCSTGHKKIIFLSKNKEHWRVVASVCKLAVVCSNTLTSYYLRESGRLKKDNIHEIEQTHLPVSHSMRDSNPNSPLPAYGAHTSNMHIRVSQWALSYAMYILFFFAPKETWVLTIGSQFVNSITCPSMSSRFINRCGGENLEKEHFDKMAQIFWLRQNDKPWCLCHVNTTSIAEHVQKLVDPQAS